MYYRRNLPHVVPAGATLFLTFRLAGSLPLTVLEQLRIEFAQPTHGPPETSVESYARQRRYFGAFDRLLDGSAVGPQWLAQPALAQIVAEALHYRAEQHYLLWAYCIMGNHVHVVLTLPEATTESFHVVLQSLKARTARACNKILNLTGAKFWQAETYDHWVRDAGEFERIVAYVLNNPVKAGLVEDWTQWPHTYLNPAW